MSTHSGMMSYLAKFWMGFYPLLLVELEASGVSIEEVNHPINVKNVSATESAEFGQKYLRHFYRILL